MSIIDEIIAKLNNNELMFDIFSSRMTIPKKDHYGSNIQGICPFHDDKNPSMSINLDKGIYYCFGCGAKGNVFQFIAQLDDLNVQDVIKQLANQVGIDYTPPSYEKLDKDHQELAQLGEKIVQWMHNNLMNDIGAQEFLLKKRGMTVEDIEKTEIGYIAPKQLNPYDKRFEKLGLAKNHYLFSEDAIIYPIRNILTKSGLPYGTLTGFSIKPIDKKKNGNSYTTYISYPSGHETGFFIGKKFNTSKGLFVTEGAADAAALHQIGYEGAISGLGAALSDERIFILLNFMLSHQVPLYIALDGDEAGQKHTKNIIHKLSLFHPEIDIRVLHIQMDLDEYIVNNKVDELKSLIKNTNPYYYELANNIDFQNGQEVQELANIGLMSYDNDRLLQEHDFEKRTNGLHFEDFIKVDQSNDEKSDSFVNAKQIKTINTKYLIYTLRYFKEYDYREYENMIKKFNPSKKVLKQVQGMESSKITSKYAAKQLLNRLSEGI